MNIDALRKVAEDLLAAAGALQAAAAELKAAAIITTTITTTTTTRADLQAVTADLIRAGGRDTAREILSRYGGSVSAVADDELVACAEEVRVALYNLVSGDDASSGAADKLEDA